MAPLCARFNRAFFFSGPLIEMGYGGRMETFDGQPEDGNSVRPETFDQASITETISSLVVVFGN